MSIKTAKSHKSRTTAKEPQPRQRASPGSRLERLQPMTSSEGSSSLAVVNPATTAPLPPPTDSVEVPRELPPEQQVWYRKPDSPVRKKAEKIAVMRAAGRPVAEIAKRVQVSEGRVRVIEYMARKNGWYDADDEPVDLEAELAYNTDRKIVRNINASLDGSMTNWQTHEMTIAAARGRGVFKNHDKVSVENQQMSMVAIQVVMPAIGAADQHINEDNVGGTPAYMTAIEGAVVGGPDVEPGHSRGDVREAEAEDVQR